MKTIIASFLPHWCELIACGKKTIEIRKTAPKEVPFKVYIYCTNRGRPLVWGDRFVGGSFVPVFTQTYGYSREEAEKIWDVFNGKVIGEFVCDKVETYIADDFVGAVDADGNIRTKPIPGEFGYWIPNEERTCFTYKELLEYGGGKNLYGWHISNLAIYDKPKELSKFEKPCILGKCPFYEECGGVKGSCIFAHPIRPPRSWMYCEELRK